MRTLLLLAVFTATVVCAFAQEEPPSGTSPDEFVKGTLALLEIGVDDATIIAHWNRSGWPKKLRDMDLVKVRDAGAGLDLLARMRGLLTSSTEFSRLAEIFRNHEMGFGEKGLLRFLRPRNWKLEKLDQQGRRLAFHEHEHELDGWFRRTSYFFYVYDAGNWSARNEAAVGRIAADAVRRRLSYGGLEVGDVERELLIHKRSKTEYPLHSVIARDPRNNLRGMVGLSTRVLEEAKLVVVVGFSARIDAANPVIPQSRDQLSEILASIKWVQR